MRYHRTLCIFLTFLFASIVLAGTEVRGQTLRLEGRVVDASSGDSLSFANVAIAGTLRGTATNENGRFVLAVDSLPVRVAVSHIGYQRIELEVTEEPDSSVIVRLEPKPITMEELVVKGRTGIFFVEKALDHVEELSEAKTRFTEGVRGFYRQKTRFYRQNPKGDSNVKSDTVYTGYVELFCNSFTSPFGIRGWSVEQGRYGQSDGPKYSVRFTNFSTLTSKWIRVPPSRSGNETKVLQPFRSNAQEYFSFEIVGHVERERRELVKIAYEAKQDLDKPALSGRLFIDAETYALHHYEGTVHSSDPVLFEAQGEMKDVTLRMSVSFRPLGDSSVPVVDRVRLDLSYDHLVADFRRRYKTTSTFFVYDYDPGETFGTSTIEYDYAAIDSVDYDPKFWRNNPVLARTPVDKAIIRSFEETGGFGHFVEEQTDSD